MKNFPLPNNTKDLKSESNLAVIDDNLFEDSEKANTSSKADKEKLSLISNG